MALLAVQLSEGVCDFSVIVVLTGSFRKASPNGEADLREHGKAQHPPSIVEEIVDQTGINRPRDRITRE